jgi:hypothetical protein
MKVYIIITSSLINEAAEFNRDYNRRKSEYIHGITTLLNRCKEKSYKLVIVENNSLLHKRKSLIRSHGTFLENFGIPVIYTQNNAYKINNYGTKELLDIKYVIQQLNIQDDDFIVKITGRYILDKECPFFDIVDNLESNPYSAIVRFGHYGNFEKEKGKDICVTGLIGLKCKYVKELYLPNDDKCIEKVWAERIASLPQEEICQLEKLGIFIRPSFLEIYAVI